MKKKYEKPKIITHEVIIENCVASASVVTDKSVILITEEEVLTDTKEWTFD